LDTTYFNDSINPVWAFHREWPFYIILNLGIGGIWPGPPDNTTIWPQFMIFDWIRVYQLKKRHFRIKIFFSFLMNLF